MIEPTTPPPPYDVVIDSSNPFLERQAWYVKLTKLDFNHEEATEYANLFVTNDININMISELNDGILKSVGIEKAGHRIRILHLQTKSPQIPRCTWHTNRESVTKCFKCHKPLCQACSQKRPGGAPERNYCLKCSYQCIIL